MLLSKKHRPLLLLLLLSYSIQSTGRSYWRNQCVKSNTVPSDKFQFSRWVGEVIKIIDIKATEYSLLYKLEKARCTLTSGNKGDSYDFACENEDDWENVLGVIKIWRDEKRLRIAVAIKHFYSPFITTDTATGSNDAIDSKPIFIESDDSEQAESSSTAAKKRKYTTPTNPTKAERIVKARTTTTTRQVENLDLVRTVRPEIATGSEIMKLWRCDDSKCSNKSRFY